MWPGRQHRLGLEGATGRIACSEKGLQLSAAVHSPRGAWAQRASITQRPNLNTDLDYTNTGILESERGTRVAAMLYSLIESSKLAKTRALVALGRNHSDIRA